MKCSLTGYYAGYPGAPKANKASRKKCICCVSAARRFSFTFHYFCSSCRKSLVCDAQWCKAAAFKGLILIHTKICKLLSNW